MDIPEKKPLAMKFAGGLIKHLGLQMYSGPVPSIAELIANAWDAMATSVKITLPVKRPIEPNDKIIVEDNGHGMTYEECDEKYLVVGLERRRKDGDLSQAYNKIPKRHLMSRKGIGKLSGFGIANIVEVRTVKDGTITHFQMDFEKMTEGGLYVRNYEPEPQGEDGEPTTEKPGTRITLKNLKISKAIEEGCFMTSMARRFAILSDPKFEVLLNGKKVKKNEIPFQFRYPKNIGGWNEETLPDIGTIRWWAGFTEKPIPDEGARGIVIFARGKLAQAPWFFDISGGAHGQHGLQYLTGEVHADFLDLTDGEDLIATDRASVLWDESPLAVGLKEWGQKKVKELLKDWVEKRGQEKRERPEIKKYLAYGDRLPEREKKIFYDYIQKITSIPQIDEDENILDELAKFGYNALTNQHFFEMIKQINAASPQDFAKFGSILSEWDIIEAVNAAQQVKGRVEIIRKFSEMIKKGFPEKPDMQDYTAGHPWLLNPIWAPFRHEKSLDTVLEKEFSTKKQNNKDGRQRLDFFCLAASYQWEVVELKRPGKKVGRKELEQIQRYVLFLREHAKKTNHSEVRVDHIGGILVYSDIEDGLGTMISALEGMGIHILTWDDLLRRTCTLHQEFLDVITEKAPTDDPRMKGIENQEKTKNGRRKKSKKSKRQKRANGKGH